MSWIDGLSHRLRTLFRPRDYERELNDEVRFHVELDTMQQRDASRARRRFGNRSYYVEETRQLTWLRIVDVVQQDARFAWRSLGRNPGLTTLIVVTFTLGIGVNAATFSVLDRIYFRPPAGVATPSELRRVWLRHTRVEGKPSYSMPMNYPMFRVIREAWGDTNDVALVGMQSDYHLGGTRAGAKVNAAFATATYWKVLGVRPQLGRLFSDEDRFGAPGYVVVLSDHLWRSQFGADASVIGKTIRLDETQVTVIGVAPAGFIGADLTPVDAWMPLATFPTPSWMQQPLWEATRLWGFTAYVHAKRGTDVSAFEQRATRALQAYNRTIGRGLGDTLMTVATGSIIAARGPGRQQQEHVLSTRLSAVAVIVLIIAAANVVNLLLARATRRRREMAVRLALGVARGRLVRMLTAETLLLALVAAATSVLAAWWGAAALRTLLLPDVKFFESAIDIRVVVFTIAIAIVAGLVSGIVPALQASNPDLTRSLKEGPRDGVSHRSRLRAALVIVQTAFSVVLVAGAALFVKSLENVRGLDLGFDAPSVVIGTVSFDSGQDPPSVVRAAKVAEVAARVAHRPGVIAVARAGMPPMYGFSFATHWIDGDSVRTRNGTYPVMNVVTPEYFVATGLRVLRGRTFAGDQRGTTQVVINEAMASAHFPRVDPLGHCMTFDGKAGTCYTIVGVVETSRRDQVIENPQPQFYLPMKSLPVALEKDWSNGSVLIARAAPRVAARVEAEVTRELKIAFPAGYPNVRLLSDAIEPQYRPWRVGAALFTSFGALALVVAMVGIYSTVSYGVSQRTHDFGVRIALGARLDDVLRLVLGESLRVVALGALLGVVLALLGGRMVASLVYGTNPGNPFVIGGASLSLLVVAGLAALFPAWRAGRVDPAIALRSD